MTANGLWQEIGAGENILTRLVRLIFMLAATAAFYFLAVLPLSWPQQAVCGLLTLLAALALARSSDSYLITLTLMIMSMFCTFRYGYWRISTTIQYFRDPGNHWGALDAFFVLCLILAETYAFIRREEGDPAFLFGRGVIDALLIEVWGRERTNVRQIRQSMKSIQDLHESFSI